MFLRRARKSLAVLALAGSLAVGAGTVPSAHAHHTPARVLLVGDSLTWQYGPVVQAYVSNATLIGGPGQDPATYPWQLQMQLAAVIARPTHIVLEDWAYPYHHPAIDPYQWAVAWAHLVQAAHDLAPNVIIVITHSPFDQFHRALPADVHLDRVPADHPDQIHWLWRGKHDMAERVLQSIHSLPH